MSVRMRINKSQTRDRRSHHGVTEPRISACEKCSELKMRHTVCEACGTYRGKQYIDVKARQEKQMKRIKRKRREMGLEPEPETSETEGEKK